MAMNVGLKISRAIDGFNDWVGKLASWLVLLLVLVGAYNTLVRYIGRFTEHQLSSNLYIEAQWYLFSLVFLLGASYTLRRGSHVRVDLIYGRLGRRGKAWIDVLGTTLLLLPFSIFCLWVSWPAVYNSWVVREISPDPGGLPRYPIKSMILVAFVLLILQGVSELIKNVHILRQPRSVDDAMTGDAEGAH